jgi:hypothetical protein
MRATNAELTQCPEAGFRPSRFQRLTCRYFPRTLVSVESGRYFLFSRARRSSALNVHEYGWSSAFLLQIFFRLLIRKARVLFAHLLQLPHLGHAHPPTFFFIASPSTPAAGG